MSELIQQLSVPAKTTIAREFPGSDVWDNHPFLIKFGDFEVQVMDKNMETILVSLDDHLFVDGKLVEGSPGDSFPSNKNNHHSITADEPLPPTATLNGHSTDQGQDLQDHAHSPDVTSADDLRKSVSLCNQTIADLVDKKLLKFTKSKRGFFKKQTTTFSQEREEVLETLHRLSEQSRLVAQNEDIMKRQLGINQRNQVILERIVSSFGKELEATNSQILELSNQLESTNIQCQELKDKIKENDSRWAEKLTQKDIECQKIRKGEKLMAQLVKERDHMLLDVTKDLSNAKGLVQSLEAANADLATKNTVLLDVITKEKEMHRKVADAKNRLCGENKCLESGVKMMEVRIKEQRQFYEDQMNKMKESYAMEIIQMKKTTDAEKTKRDEFFQDLRTQLTKGKKFHESLKGEIAVIRTRIEEKEKQNEDLNNEVKLVKKSLDLVTDERARLIVCQQEQVDHLHNEIKVLKEKLMDEHRCRARVEDLHQRLTETKKAEEDRFTVRQVELFLKSCADNVILLDETMRIQKKHIEQAAEANRRCTHLEQNNKQLQKKMREERERYSALYRDFEQKLQGRLVASEKNIPSRSALKDRRSIPAAKKVHPLPRIKELECQLVQKTKEQEDMRVLIRWLKKDPSKVEKDLAQATSERKDLIASMEQERTDHKREVNDLKRTFAQEKLVEKNVYEMRDSKNRRLAKKMTDLHRQLKISYQDLQKSKIEADEEIERLKACVSEMEDEMDEMDEELENNEQDIEELEEDLDDAEYDIEQNEKQIRKLKTQVEELLKTKKNLEKKLRSFQSRA